jgi:hypothetical protein
MFDYLFMLSMHITISNIIWQDGKGDVEQDLSLIEGGCRAQAVLLGTELKGIARKAVGGPSPCRHTEEGSLPRLGTGTSQENSTTGCSRSPRRLYPPLFWSAPENAFH